jgi:anti-anti-sigma regulatory factor
MATDIEGSHLAPDLFCLTVTGEIDMANADELDEAIDEALHVNGVTR